MLSNIATFLTLSVFASAAPLASRQQIVPDLPAQLDLVAAETQVKAFAYQYSGRYRNNHNSYGEFINSIVPISNDLDSLIGADNVLALDILADRLCIAGRIQGSVCNEVLAYAYSWIAIQEKGKTWAELTQILGKNNMNILKDDINVLCIGDEHDQFNKELCQVVLDDVDVLANNLIGTASLSEDNGNDNTLEHYGLANLLPAPQTITK